MSQAMYSSLDSAVAIALLLKRSARVRSRDWPYVRDISRLLFDLRQRGFRFRDLGLRRIPDGYYSEDVETFVGQLLSMGYATQRSPIRLEPKGEQLCDQIVKAETQDNKEEFELLERTVDDLLRPLPATS